MLDHKVGPFQRVKWPFQRVHLEAIAVVKWQYHNSRGYGMQAVTHLSIAKQTIRSCLKCSWCMSCPPLPGVTGVSILRTLSTLREKLAHCLKVGHFQRALTRLTHKHKADCMPCHLLTDRRGCTHPIHPPYHLNMPVNTHHRAAEVS